MVKNQLEQKFRLLRKFFFATSLMLVACQQPVVVGEPVQSKTAVSEPVTYSVKGVRITLLCKSQEKEHLSCQSKPVKAALKAVEEDLLKAKFRVFMTEEPSATITSYLSISTDQIKRGDDDVIYVSLDLKAVDSATGEVIAIVVKEDKFVAVVKEQNSERNRAYLAKRLAGGTQFANEIAKAYRNSTHLATASTDFSTQENESSATNSGITSSTTFPGNYHALVIGINRYWYLDKLNMAVKDARTVAQLLEKQYGFTVTMLLDEQATRDGIMGAFNQLNQKLTENDHLLIYYAGHGIYELNGEASYWLPVNAKNTDDIKWIIASSITTHLRRNLAKNILVVADSCYAGTLTRSGSREINLGLTENERHRYLEKMLNKKSRVLIASGGKEPVLDSGGQGHSIFARVFLEALHNMKQSAFTAEELFIKQSIRERVAGKVEQTPEFQIIRESGHESGDFVFQRQ